MTENEEYAMNHFDYGMYKAKVAMINILADIPSMSDKEFSRKMHAELARYDGCLTVRDYYSNGETEVCNVSED